MYRTTRDRQAEAQVYRERTASAAIPVAKKVIAKIDTVTAFAAACLANRINGGEYIKADTIQPEGQLKLTNKALTLQAIAGELEITQADREQAQLVMTYISGFTMDLLAGKQLSEFNLKALSLASQEEITVKDIGWVAYLPVMFDRGQSNQAVQDRLFSTVPQHLGKVGDKIEVTVEVVKTFHSFKYNCWFITAVTDTNHAVFFSKSTDPYAVGQTVRIRGTVKAHRDEWQTQLSRTKQI
jgi:hypothetical protein